MRPISQQGAPELLHLFLRRVQSSGRASLLLATIIGVSEPRARRQFPDVRCRKSSECINQLIPFIHLYPYGGASGCSGHYVIFIGPCRSPAKGASGYANSSLFSPLFTSTRGDADDMKRRSSKLIPFSAVPRLVKRRVGKKPHLSSVYRWHTRGINGVRLRAIFALGSLRTCDRWICEFWEEVARAKDSASPSGDLPGAERLAEAERQLEQDGI